MIADAPACGRVVGTKACRLQDTGRVVCFSTKRTRYLFGHVHTVATLVIENHTVATGGHTTVHTKRGGFVAYASVVSVKAVA